MHCQRVLVVGAFIVGFLAFLWALICWLLYDKVPNVLTPKSTASYDFDYVIVGAGTAGSVIAGTLAKHSNLSILLIEAGDTFGLLSKVPLLATFQQQGLNDWAFRTVTQQHSSRGLEQAQQCLPRGKGLGGSAQLNYMLEFPGYGRDFYAWHKAHALTDWRWSAVQPFMTAALGKPYEVFEIPWTYSKITESLRSAKSEFVHKPWLFRAARYNIKNGLRYSNYQRFLQPALADNTQLRLMLNTLVRRILLDKADKRAQSIVVGRRDEYTHQEQLLTIGVRRELILCAGAFQSPQLLLASGIGPSDELRALNISVQHHLAQVGRNLHDHINLPLYFSVAVVGPTLNQRALLDPWQLLSYLSSGTGHLGNFGVLGHVHGYEEPGAEFGLTFFGVGAVEESALMSISNFKRSAFRALFPRHDNLTQEGFVVVSSCLQPSSRGTVTIKSVSMRRNPLINPNYLQAPADINCTIAGIRSVVEIVSSAAFAELRPHLHWPKLKDCARFGPFEQDFRTNQPSDRYLACVLRHVGLSSHHPGGTCAMGTNSSNSVVDAQFRLHGVPNLRIIDASVLPIPVSGNPNSVITAIALRAATWILADELQDSNPVDKAEQQ